MKIEYLWYGMVRQIFFQVILILQFALTTIKIF